MKDKLLVFKALANETRLSIYEIICNYDFLTKTQLMRIARIDNRPSLEHHLTSLKGAGLVAEKELLIDNQRLVFVVTRRKIDFNQEFLKDYPEAIKALDRLGGRVKATNYNEIVDKEPNVLLRIALRSALGNAILATGRKFRCELCQGLEVNKATTTCLNCGRFICHDCSRNIKRPTGIIEIYCIKCENEFFYTRH
ncbi:MAG: hypothetical protein ACXAEU_08540 [Candidatus Hodarchaeales archaeon]|jgi:DNA-binding transcriptional ArsR family regulator